VALIGEVEENPSVIGFETLRESLVEELDRWNADHPDSLLVPLAAPGGFPEFVGVLRDLGTAYRLARALAEVFHPLAVRMAAAQGPVALPPGKPDPEQLEGPAFDAASELLYRARKEDRLLLLEGGEPVRDALVNALVLVLHRDMQAWTDRQCEVVRLYREHGRQSEVAERLGISQQSVSSSLTAARWRTLQDAERTLLAVLSGAPLP
jgi:hypothetical protein